PIEHRRSLPLPSPFDRALQVHGPKIAGADRHPADGPPSVVFLFPSPTLEGVASPKPNRQSELTAGLGDTGGQVGSRWGLDDERARHPLADSYHVSKAEEIPATVGMVQPFFDYFRQVAACSQSRQGSRRWAHSSSLPKHRGENIGKMQGLTPRQR